jgi:mannose-6-phosphate isomerase
MSLKPIRLLPSFREKIWGATALEPWFPQQDRKIGEVWFSADDNLTDRGVPLGDLTREFGPALLGRGAAACSFPILVKFIFTSDRLSIQVHPDDRDAERLEGLVGKTEMWHVLRAERGARIALGFREAVTRQRLYSAALSGEIEDLVHWFRVKAGDTFFTPPGTVHAIGSGVALCEIQQQSDLTYRLYDYGRPRELHLDKSVQVADLNPHPGRSVPVTLPGGMQLLARCRYFATERLELETLLEYRPNPERCDLLIFLAGRGSLDGRRFAAGDVWLVPACATPFCLAPDLPVSLLRTYVPEASAEQQRPAGGNP